MSSASSPICAIDIGGTKIAIASVRLDTDTPTVTDKVTIPTEAKRGGADVTSRLRLAVGEYLDEHPDCGHIAISTAGVVDPHDGHIASATDLMPGWAGQDPAGELHRMSGLDAHALNDVMAHGMGEAHYGAGREYSSMVCVAIGTGIGGSIITHGTPFFGMHGVAGHVGHVPHPAAAGFDCSCGATSGHIEAIASGTGMCDLYNATRPKGTDAVSDGKELQQLIDAGDDYAVQIAQRSGAALGETLAGVANLVDPDAFILSGSVVKTGPLWWQALTDAYRNNALPLVRELPLVQGSLGGDAPLIGAAHYATKGQL